MGEPSRANLPGLNSLLVNYVELVRSSPAATGSKELYRVVKTQALDAAKSLDFQKTVDFRELRSLMNWVLIALVGFSAMLWLFGDSMKLAAQRYLGANLLIQPQLAWYQFLKKRQSQKAQI